MSYAFPKLHNAAWPGVVGKGSPDGEPLPPNEKGIMVITRPFPGLTPMLWGETER